MTEPAKTAIYPLPADRPRAELYRDQPIALLTQHGKERVIAPVLNEALGCQVQHISGYDTDLLGTFTREIPRSGTQLEAARKKARIGMELSGLPLGLASEGAFGRDPVAGMISWNVEFVIFLDDLRGFEVVGVAQSPGHSAHRSAASWGDVEAFARMAHFPNYQLILRPEDENDPRVQKGIADWDALRAAYAKASAQSAEGAHGLVFVEIDLRAHANPARLNNIRLAAVNLKNRLCSLCPVCQTPGFWVTEVVAGLPCNACGASTRESRADILGCSRCDYRVMRERSGRQDADPGCCDVCNP